MKKLLSLDLFEDTIISCELEGITLDVKRGSVVGKMARYLVELGHDPESEVVVFRGSTLCFHPRTLSKWAATSVKEGDRSIQFVTYRPFGGLSDE